MPIRLPFRRSPPPATPRVDVVVPLYNHARFIAEAIASVAAQGAVVRRIVVVDDGSTDGSAQVMAGLAAQDARIGFRTQPNRGAHATLNAAIAETEAEFVAILNSDDAYMPGRLAALLALLDAAPGAAIAASGLAFMDAQSQPTQNAWQAQALAAYRAGGDMAAALVGGNFLMTTSNLLVRRAAFGRIGGFAALRYAHDLDFLLRALALGERVAFTEAPLLRYRIHPGNTIAEEHRRVRADWALAAAAFLTALWDRPGAAPIDWARAAAIQDTLRRHELSRAVALCMAALRREGAPTLDRSTLADDPMFRERLEAWV